MTKTDWVARRFPWQQQRDKQLQEIRELTRSVNAVVAVITQSVLLEYAEDHPEIESFSFDANYEYDDEGSYFWTACFYAIDRDGNGADELEEFHDLIQEQGMEEAECMLAFESKDNLEGSITVPELREAWAEFLANEAS